MPNFIWTDHADRESLPIDAHLAEILRLTEENQVIIVEAETGAGKTTRIPQMLLQETSLPIQMTQPRRPVVRWMAKRIAYELKDVPGGVVGWKLFGDDPVVSKRTRCLLKIEQSLANWIRRKNRLPEGIIIVDEAHERHVTTDTLLILLKKLLLGSPKTKVIITSATIDTERFSKYFWNAPILKISGRCYPVEVRPYHMGRGEHHSQGAICAAEKVVDNFLRQCLHIQDTHNEFSSVLVERGTVLAFFPGEEDINSAISSLERHLHWRKERDENLSVEVITLASEAKNKKEGGKDAENIDAKYRIEIFPCHGKLTPAEQDRSQGPDVAPNTLRVICTTDIARTSATFPRVVGVIDSLQIKRPFSDYKGVAHLDKIQVSMAEANQAKGRAGRTQPGFYIPISFEGEYGRLAMWPVPAILREPLSSIVLQFSAAGISPRDCDYIDAPDQQKIDATIKRLQKLGALDSYEQITEVGELLVQFPIDPERAKALITGSKLGILPETIIASACIEHEGLFWIPKTDAKIEVERWLAMWYICHRNENRYWRDEPYTLSHLPDGMTERVDGIFEIDPDTLSHGARTVAEIVKKSYTVLGSDFEAMVWIFREFKKIEFELREKKISGRKAEDELYGWCRRNFVNYKKLRAVELTVKQIREEVANSPLPMRNGIFEQREFDGNALSKAIASGLIDFVGVKSDFRYSSLCGVFSVGHNSACPEDAPLVLIGGIRKVPTGGRRTSFIHLADLAAPIQPEWLEEIMPQFCSYNTGINPFYSKEHDSCMSTTQIVCNGQKVGERFVRDQFHKQAPEIFARWLAGQTDLSDTMLAGMMARNQLNQQKAKTLNVLAGSPVFKEFSESARVVFYSEKLLGAGSIAEISDPNGLLFPSIDDELAKLVLSENPWEVEYFGRIREIEYRVGYAPRVLLEYKELENNNWLNLPSEGIVIPSGRQVDLYFMPDGRWDYSFKNGAEIKTWFREKLNAQQWENWNDHSVITIPDINDESAVIPEIQVVEYGKCVVDGSPLYGYGLVVSSGSSFAVKWMKKEAEAKEAHANAVKKFGEIRVEMQAKRELESAKAEATEARKKFSVLYEKHYYDRETLETIREKLSQGNRICVADNSAEGNRQYAAKINAMVAEIEAELSEIARRKAEAAADLERAVAAGEVLVGFEAWHRRSGMSGNGDGWVIRSDGSLREHDSDTVQRHKSDGTYHWDYVMGDELALKWSCGTMRDVAGASEFAVVKMPVGGLTEAQREAVRRIELDDIGTVENSFGLDPEAAERQAKLVAEAARVFKCCPACGDQLVIDENAYRALIGEYGMHICQDDQKISRLLDYNKPFDETTEGREAQIVVSKRISNGVIEALAYEKWGGWNLNLRWRKLSEEELATESDVEIATQGDGSFSEAGDRYFRCSCGRPTRLTKGDWKRYLAGEEISLMCLGCYSSGIVKKEVEASVGEKAGGNGALDISKLKEAWGK
ncbi:MAG: hypothetical protein WC848_02610 [Parcubacteria group bacterium]|jgi:HrpA-like RNA helicase